MRGTSIFQIAGAVGEEKDKKGENYIKKNNFQIVRVIGQDGVGGGRSVRLCQV